MAAGLAAIVGLAGSGCLSSSGPSMPDDFDPSKYQTDEETGSKSAKENAIRSGSGQNRESGEGP